MAEFDVLTREFMRSPDVFAEAFNGVIYGGKKVLKPSQLREYDTTLLHTAQTVKSPGDAVQKDRDIVKIAYTDEHEIYLFLGIENQTCTDYCMPARILIYDALTYDQQLKSEKLKGELSRKQHIVPVITLVCYFGLSPWRGPKTLHEMMGNYPNEILKYVPDYPLNLLDPFHMSNDEIDAFNGELGCVFECLRAHNNGEQLKNLISSDQRFSAISKTAAKLLNYRLQLNIDPSIDSQKEEINMCKAVQEMIDAAANEYKQEAQMLKEEINTCKAVQEMIEAAANEYKQEAQMFKQEAQKADDRAQMFKQEAQKADDRAQMFKQEAQKADDRAQKADDRAQMFKNALSRTISKMRQSGQSQEDIANFTGLTIQEIQALCANS